ncbi:sigma 54-interacting transcriptional regulator [Salmonella enterica subsp. enterica]|nr:sigma 54-interacting transcriptional regulator [Salmonella enterica subsp. enterica]
MTGESGTGKSYSAAHARICYRPKCLSPDAPFISFNCAQCEQSRTAGGRIFWLCEGRSLPARRATDRARSRRLTACYFSG